MLLFFQQTLLDTCLIFESDSLQNAKIYYHETVKLIESNGNWISIYVPILIAALALSFSLWQFYIGRKDRRLNNIPVVSFYTINSNDFVSIYIKNLGVGTAKITSIIYEYQNESHYCLYDIFKLKKENEELKKMFRFDDSYFFSARQDLYLGRDGELELFQINFTNRKFKNDIMNLMNNVIMRVTIYDIYNKRLDPLITELPHGIFRA